MAGVVDHAALVQAEDDVEADEARDDEQLRARLLQSGIAQEVRKDGAEEAEDGTGGADGDEIAQHEARDAARGAGQQKDGREVCTPECVWCMHGVPHGVMARSDSGRHVATAGMQAAARASATRGVGVDGADWGMCVCVWVHKCNGACAHACKQGHVEKSSPLVC